MASFSIGKFQIVGTLGSGAHSTILHIRRSADAKNYALKVVPIEDADDRKFLEQARHEFRVAQQLDVVASRERDRGEPRLYVAHHGSEVATGGVTRDVDASGCAVALHDVRSRREVNVREVAERHLAARRVDA